LASLVTTLRETLRYRGAIGQWSWVLHRLTGIGVVVFLFLHVVDTSWAYLDPASYEKAIAAYQSPLFTLGEFGLIFAVVYHALNGLRIAIFDFKPEWWRYQQRAAWWVLGGTTVILVPVFILMFGHVIEHYSHSPYVMPLGEVIWEQRIFVVYFMVGAALAAGAAFLVGMVRGNEESKMKAGISSGSNLEKFWWSFMRVSGVLIIPLVFGHLAMMHIVQGVFDLTVSGHAVVGAEASANPAVGDINVNGETITVILPDGINNSGTATEFVAERWNTAVAGIAVVRFYDTALLILVVMHGFNGLRYVLTDYTADNIVLKRTMAYLTVIGGVALLYFGLRALLGTIEIDAIEIAANSLADLRAGHGG
jgi:succinate dehydrogenase / fumarate reductase, cytochrome b subunit